MKVIGLTGSIGMGKSVTAKIFKDFGVPVFDADSCVHDLLTNNKKVIKLIAAHFPASLKIGLKKSFVDRIILGDIIFKDRKKRKVLEAIIHPEVGNQRAKWKNFVQREGYKIICYDVPLLYETKGEKYCNYIVVASCPFFLQKQRVLARKNMTEQKFCNILNNQVADYEKRKKADFIINTGNGHRFSRNQVNNLLNKILL